MAALKAELDSIKAENEELKSKGTPKNEPSDLEKRLKEALGGNKEEEPEDDPRFAELEDLKKSSIDGMLKDLKKEDREKIEKAIAGMKFGQAKATIDAILGFKVEKPAGGLPAGSTGGKEKKKPGRYEEGYEHKFMGIT